MLTGIQTLTVSKYHWSMAIMLRVGVALNTVFSNLQLLILLNAVLNALYGMSI